MIEVLVDARNITATPTGVGRYAQALLPRMIAARPEWSWNVLRHASNREPMFDARELFVPQPNDGLAHVLRGERVFRGVLPRAPQLVHSLFHIVPHNFSTAWSHRPRLVVTVHDFIWVDHPDISQPTWHGALATRQFARHAIPSALRAADRVIAVSDATAERAGRDGAQCEVIPHGVEARYFEPLPPRDAIVERLADVRYVAAVGNDKPYKNLATLLRAVARLEDVHLVLVGPCDGLRPLAAQLGIERRVIFAGSLADADLRRVVGHASAFVFPSLVEGFGLPPLEAMALGVPTIVSDLEPMRSVAGDAALRFEPTDVAALTELLRHVVLDDRLAEALAHRGREHARTFTWARTAARTLAVYDALL